MLCPHRRKPDGTAMEPTQPEINSIGGCPIKREEIRSRLSDISWSMRLLCQRVAMRANREDDEHGRFLKRPVSCVETLNWKKRNVEQLPELAA